MLTQTYMRDGRAPLPKSESVSRVMSANKGKDTGIELRVRKALMDAAVNGYATHPKNVPGKPDIVFSIDKIAVFIHGCYWHRCPKCNLPLPKTHKRFWREKFERNQTRDKLKVSELRKTGWKVLTVWECEVKKDVEQVVRKITKALNRPPSKALSRDVR